MDLSNDIQPLSEFKQNASRFLKQVRETKRPLVLTVNGKPAAVLQDVDAFQKLSEMAQDREVTRMLEERLAYVRGGGKLSPAEEVFDRISRKTGIKF